jgi:tripartite ATP-independent transporter DctM subunit
MVIFLTIIVGIMTGLMSPTEASAFGVVAALVVASIGGRFSFTMLRHSLEETMKISARLLFILAGVAIFGYFLARSGMPIAMGRIVGELGVNKYLVLAIILVMWIVLGLVMNVIPLLLLTLPAIYPVVIQPGMDFDPIWFGVIAVIVMEMGQITPPVGLVCFAVASVGKIPSETVYRGIWPFFGAMALLIFILVLFPDLATWLPNYLFR